jgi:hypothetical protein
LRRASDRAIVGPGPTVGLLLVAMAVPTWGGDLVDLQADERGGEYHIRMERMVDADPAQVRRVLTDYRHIYRLSPSIVASATLPSPEVGGGVRVETQLETCIAFFCMDLVAVADMRELSSGDLQATVVPQLSSFRYGFAGWEIHPEHGGSRVVYEVLIAPRLFLPPLIGTRLALRRLISETAVTFVRLECLAQARGHRQASSRAPEASGRAGYDCGEPG